MTRNEIMQFELYVMDLCAKCKTAEDYQEIAEQLHESVENAIQDMCMDNDVEGYEPSY